MGRVLIAGVVGGLLVFLWGYLSHAVLGMHNADFQKPLDESTLMSVVKSSAREPGAYFFPWIDPADAKDDAKQAKFAEDYKKGPNGILVRGPDGQDHMSAKTLALEFGSDVAAALIAAVIVAAIGARRTTPTKIIFVSLLGVFAWLSQNASYMIWYRFPKSMEMPELVDAAVEWFLAGVAIVLLVKPDKVK